LRQSTEVDVSLEKGEVRLVPVRQRWRLDELLTRVTKENLQDEVEWGPAAGREAW
jgi:antitoxin component of MazEF toxin-antitoxin module